MTRARKLLREKLEPYLAEEEAMSNHHEDKDWQRFESCCEMQTASPKAPDCRGESDGPGRQDQTDRRAWAYACATLLTAVIGGAVLLPHSTSKPSAVHMAKKPSLAPSRIVQHTPPTVEVIPAPLPRERVRVAANPRTHSIRHVAYSNVPPPSPAPQRIAPPEDKDQPTPVR